MSILTKGAAVQVQNTKNTATPSSSIQDFDILKKLGQGAHGVVYKVRRKQDQNTYVLKQILAGNMGQKQRKDCVNEAVLLNQLNSPYIVRYYDSFLENNQLNIVMEYCEQGDLENFIKNQMGRPLIEKRIWKLFFQIAEGLLELHSRNILHRDIKSNEQIRIGDLGVAKQLESNKSHAHSQVGTPYYMSPEIIQDIPYNEKSDVWSLGCVIYQLATYKRPFDAPNQGSLMIKIQKSQYTPISVNYSQQMHKLIEQCLTKDHKKRPSIMQLLADSEIQMKAKQVGHQIKMNIAAMSIINGSDDTKQSQDQFLKSSIKSKDLILFQKQDSLGKSESVSSQDNSPIIFNGRPYFMNSPFERSKFGSFQLQTKGHSNSQENEPPYSQNDRLLSKDTQATEKNQAELSVLIKSPSVSSRNIKMQQQVVNRSQNLTPTDRFNQEIQKEQTTKNNPSSHRLLSPIAKNELSSKYSLQLPNHMKSTKSQMGFNHSSTGVGAQSLSNNNVRVQILSQKEADMNFSKMIQQQYIVNQIQQNHKQAMIQKQTQRYEAESEEKYSFYEDHLPQINKSAQMAKEDRYMQQDNTLKRNNSQDKLLQYKISSKSNQVNSNEGFMSTNYAKFNNNNNSNQVIFQTPFHQKSKTTLITSSVQKSVKQLPIQNSYQRTNTDQNQLAPLINNNPFAKTFYTKQNVNNISNTDLDNAYNSIDEQIEAPKNTSNPHLSKLYKQKYGLQVQQQQLQKSCITALGFDLYKSVLSKFKFHINVNQQLYLIYYYQYLIKISVYQLYFQMSSQFEHFFGNFQTLQNAYQQIFQLKTIER